MVPARKYALALALGAIAATSVVWTAHLPSSERPEEPAGPRDPAGWSAEPAAAVELHDPGPPQVVARASGELPEIEPPAPAERQAVDSKAEWSAPVGGRLVDARTGEGLLRIRVKGQTAGAKDWEALTDEAGRFESPLARPAERLRLSAFDELSGKRIARLRHQHRPPAAAGPAEELHWSIEIGPTFRVRLVGGPGSSGHWRFRLLERHPGWVDREWKWIEAVAHPASGELWARYLEPEHAPESDWTPHLEARTSDDTWRGETRVPATAGLHAVELEVQPQAGIFGKALDDDGRPVAASIRVLSLGDALVAPETRQAIETEEDGSYILAPIQAGSVRLLVSSDHRRDQREVVELAPGERRRLDFHLPSIEIAGGISGEIVGPNGGPDPFALVRLESEDGGSTDLAQLAGFTLDLFGQAEENGRSPFGFEDLPRGRYRLSLIPLDGRNYSPAAQSASPPIAGVLFSTEEPKTRMLKVRFRVRDRATGAAIQDYSLMMHIEHLWVRDIVIDVQDSYDLPSGVELDWVVGAPGYRPGHVSLAQARSEGESTLLEVELERGFGAAFVIVDVDRRMGGKDMDDGEVLPWPVPAGARVLTGGKEIGRSDETGLALCASDGPITDFEVVLPGWAVLSVERFHGHAETPDGIGFVWMARQ